MAELSDAYYLAGWIRIHADDHSGAYRVWAEGNKRLGKISYIACTVLRNS